MVAIADLLGKASKSNQYAAATTVKTARIAGVSVLETFDLSKYAVDTPLFYITYKKTIDPITSAVTITNQVSYKALVNDVSNTLTNITVAPGFTDLGNDVGDFVESIPTSYWQTSLIDALLTSINPDGSLKTAAVQAALNISGATPPDYTVLANVPAITYLGQRSYRATYTAVDYTDRLQPKQRWRGVRATAAPTQSTQLDGVAQYWVKTTPNKLSTFTQRWVVDIDVMIPDYTAFGAYQALASENNGTSGWALGVTQSGKIELVGFNGGGGNTRKFTTRQSVTVGQRLRITAEYDMTSGTASATSWYVLFNGISIAGDVTTSGTAPTSIAHAGNLEIGSQSGGNNKFKGNIAQCAILNGLVTQATMINYHSQGYVGNETNLLSAWNFNGQANDLNLTTPNNLTSNGGVTALTAASPFGTQGNGNISATIEHGIIMSVTKPGADTIVIIQVPDGCAIPTSGGLTTTSFSSMDAPFGFPGQKERWAIIAEIRGGGAFASGGAANTWFDVGFGIVAPIGSFEVVNQLSIYIAVPSGSAGGWTTVSTANNGVTDEDLSVYHDGFASAGSMWNYRRKFKQFAAQTRLYALLKSETAWNNLTLQGDRQQINIRLENCLL